MSRERRAEAVELFRHAYRVQMERRLDDAAILYRQSLDFFATPEAYTFLGWTYRLQGRIDEAIDECRKAVALDPDFGNPYNDIGAYLIDLGRHEEAVPWLERALRATRYESPHYPWFNLGRVRVAQGRTEEARACFRKAIELQPDYPLAEQALRDLGDRVP